MTPRYKPHQLLQQFALMNFAIASEQSTARRRFKRSFNSIVRQEQEFSVGDYMFVYLRRLATFVQYAADKMVTHWYSKVIRRLSWPYKVLFVQPPRVTLSGEGIPNTVSIDHIMLPLIQLQVTDRQYKGCKLNNRDRERAWTEQLLRPRKKHKISYHSTAIARGMLHEASLEHTTRKKVFSEMVPVCPRGW